MLRHAFSTSSRGVLPHFVTVCQNAAAFSSSVKRALSQEQLKGVPGGVVNGTTATPSGSASELPTAGSPPSTTSEGIGGSGPTGGGGEYMFPIAVVATMVGTAWYFDIIPGMGSGATKKAKPPDFEKLIEAHERAVESRMANESAVVEAPPPEPSLEVVDEPINEEETVHIPEPVFESVAKPVVEPSQKSEPDPVPKPEPEPLPEHVREPEPDHIQQIETYHVPEPEPIPDPPVAVVVRSEPVYASVEDATRELQAARSEETSAALRKAHQSIRASIDESLYSDLESLSPSELKIRIVQLGTEMMERSKWEAIRLKEFLAMKEKEVSETYMEQMQKQRLEFEDMLARKLREQEDTLMRQTSAALQKKEAAIEAIVQATKESLEAEHQANLNSQKELLQAELNATYEASYANKLAEVKQKHLGELESKVIILEGLAKKLEEMDYALSMSRSFADGSVKAHRLSAAALALSEKLETSQGAKPELITLEVVAAGNNVISSAVHSIPKSVETGIPTLSELQTKFAKVYDKGRQAALVPTGRVGLEGQLLGSVLKVLKYEPSPDDPAPEESKDSPEYVLSRARRHVQLGELDRCVEELNKLDGQVAFTVRDWMKDAQDRIAADKALRVIKMEVALLNESMGKAVE